eukprot:1507753-Rhodomonas_salina.3
MHSSSRFASGTPLQSYAAPVSRSSPPTLWLRESRSGPDPARAARRPMTSFGPSSMPMAPVDKNEMVC